MLIGGRCRIWGGAKLDQINKGDNVLTFKDIEGINEVKAEIRELVEFLKNPKRFIDLGARSPAGVLLVGAPGTGGRPPSCQIRRTSVPPAGMLCAGAPRTGGRPPPDQARVSSRAREPCLADAGPGAVPSGARAAAAGASPAVAGGAAIDALWQAAFEMCSTPCMVQSW